MNAANRGVLTMITDLLDIGFSSPFSLFHLTELGTFHFMFVAAISGKCTSFLSLFFGHPQLETSVTNLVQLMIYRDGRMVL
jgi:hypothetical protein